MKSRITRLGGDRLAVRLLCAGVLSAGSAGVAFAQQVQPGATTALVSTYVRGVDTAYNPATGGYLVVGGQGPLYAVCINASGGATSGVMTINTDYTAQFPRAAYSPQIGAGGGFLVVWPEEVPGNIELHARTVTCSGQIGPENVISGGYNAWLESGAALAYSPTSQRFLVAWAAYAPHLLKVALVDNTGTLASGVVDISTTYARDPGVAWNPSTNQFGVSFSGESGDPNNPLNYSAFAVVSAGNPAVFSRSTFNTFYGGMNTITDLDYNPATGRYIMGWYEISSGLYAKVAEFDNAGGMVTSGIASTRLGSYDSLSLAYNPASGTFLMVGSNRASNNLDFVLGLELNSRGFPFNGENTLSYTHPPSNYARVSSSSGSRSWNAVFSAGNGASGFQGIGSFIATGFASSGGPGGAYGSAPTPPPPDSGTSSCPGTAPVAGWVCFNGSWLPPDSPLLGGGTSTGGCTTTQPGPGWTCVNGNWIAPTTSTGGCTTVQPGSNWVCVNGNWLPSDSTSTGGTSTGGCTTVQPGTNWVCVNGNWVQSTSTSTSSCTTVQPGANWVCVNGNWLPSDSPSAPAPSSGGCTTVQPGSNWVCVNGNWIQSTSTSSCTTVQPGSNWVCVNGNWIQSSTSSCTTVQPVSNWVCVNGGWVPPDSYLAPTSACTTVRPGQYWTCDAATGNWLPPQ